MSTAKRLLKYAVAGFPGIYFGAAKETKDHYIAKRLGKAQDKAVVQEAVRDRDNFLREQQNAVDKKKALFAEQESQRADGGGAPVKKTYLGSGGSSGGYIDEEAIKAKKRLGGSK